MSTSLILVFLTLAAQAPGRVAVVAGDDTQARAALESRGFVVEPRDTTAALVAEAQQVGGACGTDDAECWAKVGLYAGFERILVVDAIVEATRDRRRVVLIDVASGTVVGEGRGDDVTQAIDALFAPLPIAPAHGATPATPTTPTTTPTARAEMSLLAVATGSAATLASLCLVAGVSFELIAVDHLGKLRAGDPSPLSVKERTQAAIDAERLEIASFACAGAAGAVALAAGVLWWSE